MRREAGVVLAGGRSSRMGQPKAALEWHGSTLLRRTVGILQRAVDGPVVVVRAAGQELPTLPPAVRLTDDPVARGGPVVGLLAGLRVAAESGAEVAYVASTDAPMLTPAFVRRVLAAVDADVDVALPDALGHRQPLAAAYRTALVPVLEELVAGERLRPAFLFERVSVRVLGEAELRAADPTLGSLRNLNEPAEYRAARAEPPPRVLVDGVPVRAATLGAAWAAVGAAPDHRRAVTVNGSGVACDAELPLVEGDVVALAPAGPTS